MYWRTANKICRILHTLFISINCFGKKMIGNFPKMSTTTWNHKIYIYIYIYSVFFYRPATDPTWQKSTDPKSNQQTHDKKINRPTTKSTDPQVKKSTDPRPNQQTLKERSYEPLKNQQTQNQINRPNLGETNRPTTKSTDPRWKNQQTHDQINRPTPCFFMGGSVGL